ncbi:hypothetical protein B6R96_36285 (plasmid) [Streptomyces sp. Sge12]|uniref:hypothetical protein n=1 Tax=Streptomyces sp. Sge12 TaxID=1972846 RepID=UPI0009C1AD41|nr:hypothetical protein [Streptomyces sp. Sge12]ARE79479.1 hypothetical protein B6R96_36285 [Streptomyces sp. Sge12]
MTTLGDLFDVAVARLQEAGQAPLASNPHGGADLVDGVVHILEEIGKGIGPRGNTSARERSLTVGERNLQGGLKQATQWLATAQNYLRGQSGSGSVSVNDRLVDAGRALVAVRDTVSSHLGPDRGPLTPYAYLLSHQAGLDYLVHRYSEVAYAAGQVVHRLAQDAEHPGAVEAFEAARLSLNGASVHARAAARSADHSLASFPLALAVEPVQASPTDLTSTVTLRLEQDSERLSRVAYGALHDRAEQRLSGADLKQLSRWTAMTRMLSGRVLRRVADEMPEDPAAAGLIEAAGALRTSARAWDAAAEKWAHVVDISDPREHPQLPPPGYELVRSGRVTRLPSPDPHPAVVISRTACVRVGQLLFGAQWTPEQAPRPSRPAAEILEDAGGLGALAASLYRLPAAGWQMAVAAPWTVKRAGAGLVTDAPEYRPAQLEPDRRFYPVHLRQVEAFTSAYAQVMGAEQAAASSLLKVARRAGTSVPRAALDASAHQTIVREQKWVTPTQIQDPARNLPRAHVPTELLTGRRPGLRR